MVQMDDEPDRALEKVGDALGVVRRRVKGDLERFKELIEERGRASRRLARRGRPDDDALTHRPPGGARRATIRP
jgi:hypothetical protein